MNTARQWWMPFCVVVVLLAAATVRAAAPSAVPPLFAMDNSFVRPDTTLDQQIDLIAGLGYSGTAWHEKPVAQLQPVLAALDRHHLKMAAIYCAAAVTADGHLTYSPHLGDVIHLFKGRGTLIWLHIGGHGPAIASLTADSPIVTSLRHLADLAAADHLPMAIYPHFGMWTGTFEDAVKVARLVDRPNFGATFNLCHCLANGNESRIPKLLESGRDKLTMVTLCGADAGVHGGNWSHLIQPLGEGSYDVGILLNKLHELHYTGPIGFQGYHIPGPPRTTLTKTMEAWRRYHASSAAH